MTSLFRSCHTSIYTKIVRIDDNCRCEFIFKEVVLISNNIISIFLLYYLILMR